MSDTPKAADDVMKLLDRGAIVVLRKSELGSYSAVAFRQGFPAYDAVDNAVATAVGADGDEGEGDKRWRYLCGVCWKKIRDREGE